MVTFIAILHTVKLTLLYIIFILVFPKIYSVSPTATPPHCLKPFFINQLRLTFSKFSVLMLVSFCSPKDHPVYYETQRGTTYFCEEFVQALHRCNFETHDLIQVLQRVLLTEKSNKTFSLKIPFMKGGLTTLGGGRFQHCQGVAGAEDRGEYNVIIYPRQP